VRRSPRSEAAGHLAGFFALLSLAACARRAAPAAAPSPAPPEPEPVSVAVEAEVDEAPEPVAAPIRIEGYSDEIAALLVERSLWWRYSDLRISLARRGPVRLTPEGPDLGLADGGEFSTAQRFVVVDDGPRPRIATDTPVRWLLYVDRADAQPVVVAPVPVRPKATTKLDSRKPRGHAVLQPGAWVDIVTPGETDVEVTYQRFDQKGVLQGWVDAAALGTTIDMSKVAPAPDRVGYAARRSTTIRATPGGKVLGTIDADDGMSQLAPGTREGHRFVEYGQPCEDGYTLVGYVKAADLFQPNTGHGYGCGGGSGTVSAVWGEFESAPRVQIAAGRFLLDPDHPTLVGCVAKPTEFADLGDGRFAAATIWGPIRVRLAPEDFEGSCAPAR
jgi:hypothetical protein